MGNDLPSYLPRKDVRHTPFYHSPVCSPRDGTREHLSVTAIKQDINTSCPTHNLIFCSSKLDAFPLRSRASILDHRRLVAVAVRSLSGPPLRTVPLLSLSLQPSRSRSPVRRGVRARQEAASVRALRSRRERRCARVQLKTDGGSRSPTSPLSPHNEPVPKASLEWTKKGWAMRDVGLCQPHKCRTVQRDIPRGLRRERDAPAECQPNPRPRYRAELSQLFE